MNAPKEFEFDVVKKENERLKEKLEKNKKSSVFSCLISSIVTLLMFNFQKIMNIYENALELSFPNMIIEFIKIPLACFIIAALISSIIETIFNK